ncbi:MAG: DUF6382 domain-containing protein [Eubacteriales bacterium]|nr:DUF6382 domain-containing protein [Eubacteriales bacterium]
MNVSYKRDLNSNYMILTDEEEGAEESYEARMLTENRIYGFLPCVSQKHGARAAYYYEITGRQCMGLLYERRKLGYKQLQGLLRELLRILEAAGEYLLKPEHLILKPEYMYLNTETEKLSLCYYPGYSKDIREAFLELAEYLLGRLDKGDAEGIEFGYDLYQRALEPNFSLPEILQAHTAPAPAAPAMPEPEEEFISVREEMLEKTGSWKNFFRKKKKSQPEDYAAEAAQLKSGSVLFLREQERAPGTTFLQEETKEGLALRSKNADYPDLLVTGDSYLVGKRRESVDGCVPAPTVSRIHARIIKERGMWFLEDLNSTNGTWAGQTQLNPYELFPLEDGMRVAFAGAEYEARLR